MSTNKIALLDTDFTNKMYISKQDDEHRMIDQIVQIPGYRFACHAQIEVELHRHGESALRWLQDKKAAGDITVYSDVELLEKLFSTIGVLGIVMYIDMLEQSCEPFSAKFFQTYYQPLHDLRTEIFSGNTTHTVETVAQIVAECDEAVGTKKNLGEIKTYVLAQILEYMGEGSIFLFCSDDQGARQGVFELRNPLPVECVSALGAFYLLNRMFGMDRTALTGYFTTWMNLHLQHNQREFKVYDQKSARLIRVEGWKLLDDICKGLLFMRADGFLQYGQR